MHTSSSPQSSASWGNGEIALGDFQEVARLITGSCTSTDAEEWFRHESESLVHWAELRGWLLDPATFKRLTENLALFQGGAEHQVMFLSDQARVLKVTKPPMFGQRGSLLEYVNNIIWSNFLFEDDIRIEGVLVVEQGVSVVISQPHIDGVSPSLTQIEDWFVRQGYRKTGHNRWKHDEEKIEVADCHEGNFIVVRNDMFPIDLQVLHPGIGYAKSGVAGDQTLVGNTRA